MFNFIQYYKSNNYIEKNVFINDLIIAKMFKEEMNSPLKGEEERKPTKKMLNIFGNFIFKFY